MSLQRCRLLLSFWWLVVLVFSDRFFVVVSEDRIFPGKDTRQVINDVATDTLYLDCSVNAACYFTLQNVKVEQVRVLTPCSSSATPAALPRSSWPRTQQRYVEVTGGTVPSIVVDCAFGVGSNSTTLHIHGVQGLQEVVIGKHFGAFMWKKVMTLVAYNRTAPSTMCRKDYMAGVYTNCGDRPAFTPYSVNATQCNDECTNEPPPLNSCTYFATVGATGCVLFFNGTYSAVSQVGTTLYSSADATGTQTSFQTSVDLTITDVFTKFNFTLEDAGRVMKTAQQRLTIENVVAHNVTVGGWGFYQCGGRTSCTSAAARGVRLLSLARTVLRGALTVLDGTPTHLSLTLNETRVASMQVGTSNQEDPPINTTNWVFQGKASVIEAMQLDCTDPENCAYGRRYIFVKTVNFASKSHVRTITWGLCNGSYPTLVMVPWRGLIVIDQLSGRGVCTGPLCRMPFFGTNCTNATTGDCLDPTCTVTVPVTPTMTYTRSATFTLRESATLSLPQTDTLTTITPPPTKSRTMLATTRTVTPTITPPPTPTPTMEATHTLTTTITPPPTTTKKRTPSRTHEPSFSAEETLTRPLVQTETSTMTDEVTASQTLTSSLSPSRTVRASVTRTWGSMEVVGWPVWYEASIRTGEHEQRRTVTLQLHGERIADAPGTLLQTEYLFNCCVLNVSRAPSFAARLTKLWQPGSVYGAPLLHSAVAGRPARSGVPHAQRRRRNRSRQLYSRVLRQR